MKLKIIIPVVILVVWLGIIVIVTWERDYDYLHIGMSYDNLVELAGENECINGDEDRFSYYHFNQQRKFLGYYYDFCSYIDNNDKLSSFWYVRYFDKENVAKGHFYEVREDLIKRYGEKPFLDFSDYERWKNDKQWVAIWSFKSKQDFGEKLALISLVDTDIESENKYKFTIEFRKQY